MSDMVWLLWFEQEREDEDDTELLIGVYRTEMDAWNAVERLKDKPGFSDYPAGFQVHTRILDKDSWTEGFARVC